MATTTKFVFGVVNSAYTKGAIGTCLSNGTQKTVALTKYGGSTNDFGGDPHVLALNKNVTVDGSTCYAATIASNYTYQTSYRGKAVYGLYDGLTFGSPKKVAKSDNESSFSTTNIWNATNPYSAVMGTNCFYINDFDMTTTDAGTNKIYQINASDFTQKMVYYTAPTISGYTRCSCVALNEYNGMLLALFNYYNYSSGTFTYTNSKLVLLPKNESATSAVSAIRVFSNGLPNANTLTVSGNYVYVTSFGGAQVAGGNSNSKIQVLKITQSGSTYSISSVRTIEPSNIPSETNYGTTNGDFMGIETVTGTDNNSYAVILVARYNNTYSQYEYALFRFLETAIQASGTLSQAGYKAVETVSPAGPTWGLIKDRATGELFIAIGKGIGKVNATTSSITVSNITNASDYAISSSVTGYVLNTATYNTHVAVSSTAKGGEETLSTTTVPAGTVQTVIRPHLTREEIDALRK
ncbi:MAG: hypothetical protein IJV18_09990 [Acidaminococcaceae bacterium]|nr:hypothetical protein [Acidaminococcaceae bacterium]